MEKAAINLPAVQSHSNGLPLYFLTGKNYLYQTLFCIQSLNKCSSEHFKFILVDDGTFSPEIISQIKRQLPGAEIIIAGIIEKNLEAVLPKDKFPVLHHKRSEYPHIKKLTDVHTIPGNSWKIVLDSDMMFWDNPDELIAWLKHPDKPVHMVDCEESYGYPHKLMEQLAGAIVASKLNVGIIGLESDVIDWQMLENWIIKLETTGGKSYYLEQALSTMLVAGCDCLVLNKDKYIVNPGNDTILNAHGTLHHYVDLSKKGYYTKAWRKVI